MRLTTIWILLVIVLAACGDGATEADAVPAPDAAPVTDARVCPTDFVGSGLALIQTDVDELENPIYAGLGSFTGTDATNNLLVTVYDLTDVQLGVGLVPVFNTAPAYVMLFHDLDVNDRPRITLVTTGGTLTLTRACATGLAGTLTDATFQEATGEEEIPSEVVAGGCTLTIPSLTFDIGGPCP